MYVLSTNSIDTRVARKLLLPMGPARVGRSLWDRPLAEGIDSDPLPAMFIQG